MKILTALVSKSILLLFYLNLQAANYTDTKVNFVTVDSEDEWSDVVKNSTNTGKIIFVDVYTDWCGYCKMMDRDVFSDQEVGEYMNKNFVSVKLDAETDFGESFAAKHKVSGYPTYIFLDKSESLIGTISGYNEKAEFLAQSSSIEQIASKLPSLEKKYKSGKLNRQEKAQYALLLKDSDPAIGEQLAAELLSELAIKDFTDSEFSDFLSTFAVDINSDFFKYIEANKTEYESKLGKEKLEVYLGNVYNSLLSEAIMEKDENKVKAVTQRVLPIYVENDADLPEAEFVTRKLYYVNISDASNYIKSVENHYSTLAEKDQEFWYEQAYEIIDEYNHMEELVSASISWIEKSLKIKEDYETYALYAYALGMQGEFNLANEKANKAKTMARDEEQTEMANELIEMIESAASGN